MQRDDEGTSYAARKHFLDGCWMIHVNSNSTYRLSQLPKAIKVVYIMFFSIILHITYILLYFHFTSLYSFISIL